MNSKHLSLMPWIFTLLLLIGFAIFLSSCDKEKPLDIKQELIEVTKVTQFKTTEPFVLDHLPKIKSSIEAMEAAFMNPDSFYIQDRSSVVLPPGYEYQAFEDLFYLPVGIAERDDGDTRTIRIYLTGLEPK